MIKDILCDTYTQMFENEREYLTTGFNELDECFLSGVEKGSLITIGSRPAMGKSTFMMSIIENLLKDGKSCLFINLESSKEISIKRLMSQISEVGMRKVNHKEYMRNKDWEKLAECLSNMIDYKLTLFDCSSLEDIKDAINKSDDEFIFIDYLQLIEYKSKRPRSEVVSMILQELKKLARAKNCIIFITSQLSRALECRMDKRPMLSDLRESGEIEDISDLVMFIYREEYYHTFADDEDYAMNKGKAEIIIAKNKVGPTGMIHLLFRSDIPKFYNPVIQDVF